MIEYSVERRLAVVTLNAPPHNIVTSALATQLREAFENLRRREDHNAIVIRSFDHTVFSAGADIKEHIGRENSERMLKAAHAMIGELLRAPVPTICVIGGNCLGGGFELALACDQIRCLESCNFGTPEITLGCYPPAAMALMHWKLPAMLAAELMQSGKAVSGLDLMMRGCGVNCDAEGGARVEDIVRDLAEIYENLPRGPLVIATRLLRAGAAERFLAQVGGIEQVYLEQLLQLHDAKEGPEAFLAKRKPVWDHT